MTAVREITGSNITAGSCVYHDSHCDIQPWARAAHLHCSAEVDSSHLPTVGRKIRISFQFLIIINGDGDVDVSSLPADSHHKLFGVVWGLAATRRSVCIHQNHQFIIIAWVVRRRTLPFLRECSMHDGSVPGDRRLPGQCWAVQGRTQASGARYQRGDSSLSGVRPSWPSGLGLHVRCGYLRVETAGSDNTGEWWLVSTSANLFVGNAGPLRCSAHCD